MKLEPATPERVTPEPVTPECPRDVERPIMLQGWHDLASVHWAYNPLGSGLGSGLGSHWLRGFETAI